ncbi:MAG: gliding motility-associated C-terminal domain-containing protein [Bacteroidales bacterium]
MHRIVFLSILFLTVQSAVYAQLESNIWYFGANAGITFSTNPPSALTNGALYTMEGSASICNSSGNLLFYTDGATVYNKAHLIMDNGTGLHGNISTTQSAIIVPKPGSNTIYYIFTADVQNLNNYGLQYSTVDISMNLGLGKVISKNILLIQPTSEKITVVKHSNNSSYWLITHGALNNSFYSFLINSTGITITPVISVVGSYQGPGLKLIGYLKASFNHQKLASAKNDGGEVEIFDFDNSSGIVSNPLLIGNNEEFYGLEFSADNSKLYVTVFSPPIIYQFDLLSANIAASKNIVSYGQIAAGALQIGLDQKIYFSDLTKDSLGVINNPNATNCNFVPNAIYLGGKSCKDGLPNFIPSLIIPYFPPQAVFKVSDSIVCQGDKVIFTNNSLSPYTSQKWVVNGVAFDTSMNTSYIFQNSGSFILSLIVFNNANSDTSSITIKVNAVKQASIHPEICQGETFATGNHIYSLTGNYKDTLFTYTGCDSIVNTNLTVTPFPVFNLGNDSIICLGEIIILKPSVANAGYLWQDGSQNPVYIVSQQGLYWVKASIGSCSITDSIYISIDESCNTLYFPNAFVPEGINKIFKPKGDFSSATEYYFAVFNRWGQLLFETKDFEQGWNGICDGVALQSGVYVYYIRVQYGGHLKLIEKTGKLTLIE